MIHIIGYLKWHQQIVRGLIVIKTLFHRVHLIIKQETIFIISVKKIYHQQLTGL